MYIDYIEVERILGYEFKNKELLELAFTHASYANEHKFAECGKVIGNNDRLEFLGDSVLGLIVARRLYGRIPQKTAGEMTEEKQMLVSTVPLSEAIKGSGLGKFLLCGESLKKEEMPKKVLENLCESLIAAIYIDGGEIEAETFIEKFIFSKQPSSIKKEVHDYKGELQEYSQSIKAGKPEYELISKDGPDHDPKFVISVCVVGVTATGVGKSKGEASQMAAKEALKIIKDRRI